MSWRRPMSSSMREAHTGAEGTSKKSRGVTQGCGLIERLLTSLQARRFELHIMQHEEIGGSIVHCQWYLATTAWR